MLLEESNPGKKIGHNSLVQGIAGTYEKEHLGKPAVIKVFEAPYNPSRDEIRKMYKLNENKNIVQILDCDSSNKPKYIIKEYSENSLEHLLKQFLDKQAQIEQKLAVSITKDILSALQKAHEIGIIHANIKPSNIMLHKGEAKLTDFGSLGLDCENSQKYTAPEYPAIKKNYKSDLYSVGALLYHMLVGSPPEITQGTQIKKPENVPSHLAKILARALNPDIEKRFQSASEFLRAFSSLGSLLNINVPMLDYLGAIINKKTGLSAAAAVLLAWLALFAGPSVINSCSSAGNVRDEKKRAEIFSEIKDYKSLIAFVSDSTLYVAKPTHPFVQDSTELKKVSYELEGIIEHITWSDNNVYFTVKKSSLLDKYSLLKKADVLNETVKEIANLNNKAYSDWLEDDVIKHLFTGKDKKIYFHIGEGIYTLNNGNNNSSLIIKCSQVPFPQEQECTEDLKFSVERNGSGIFIKRKKDNAKILVVPNSDSVKPKWSR